MINSLKFERERLNLTQAEVANAIGVGKASYVRWEGGKAIPSDKLNELAKLGFDINFVVTGEHNSAHSLNKNNYQRAMRIVMLYVVKSGREVKDADLFVQVVNEVYQVIEQCEQESKEVDQVDIGTKIINLFAA
ncbi:helix-turn-helix transcriptional regulator [Pseudoalteromonas sp. NZS100]|uniref:helix-turn-helix transcriptional regulator n=1 Tax=Pseudoalteromonas sp. NZS100 TaxID=2792046 RepID=UPI0018CCC721|nr:helix-turn-helix transcriptional regulator [Pseudoalteromonas sp. NZS100]MBH0066774.1 helix-turn-helix transcriptional regulator [Pseudoalteromonas sp. NZS100]